MCFVGIDGPGRSTLGKSLMVTATEQGIKCKYVWGGFDASFTILRPLVGAVKSTVLRGNECVAQS